MVSELFNRPLLIYDDKCASCYNFALTVNNLSRGWIRIEGHYHSKKIQNINKIIFPPNYNPTKMFWLVNKKGAWGGRSGLIPLFFAILRGRSQISDPKIERCIIECQYNFSSSCSSFLAYFGRSLSLFRNSAKFEFSS